ncbi:MAG: nuclear transport factor 2 family protein [Ilumatobacteraceae bacterium]
MERDDVMAWVGAYVQAWRSADVSAVPTLFTEDVAYATSPYAAPMVGHDAIADFWIDDDLQFVVDAEPVAVDGRAAVVRLHVSYTGPPAQEWRDLWILRFAPDGRVEAFEEWPLAPRRAH